MPTLVIVFQMPSPTTARCLQGVVPVSGYFIAGEDANVIAVNAQTSDSYGVIFHEDAGTSDVGCSESGLHASSGVNEGLAELYQMFEALMVRTAFIGKPSLQNLYVVARLERADVHRAVAGRQHAAA